MANASALRSSEPKQIGESLSESQYQSESSSPAKQQQSSDSNFLGVKKLKISQ